MGEHPVRLVIDPLAAMRSACMAIADGEANEIEMEWRNTVEDRIDQPSTEVSLTITVRREVRQFPPVSHGTATEEKPTDD